MHTSGQSLCVHKCKRCCLCQHYAPLHQHHALCVRLMSHAGINTSRSWPALFHLREKEGSGARNTTVLHAGIVCYNVRENLLVESLLTIADMV